MCIVAQQALDRAVKGTDREELVAEHRALQQRHVTLSHYCDSLASVLTKLCHTLNMSGDALIPLPADGMDYPARDTLTALTARIQVLADRDLDASSLTKQLANLAVSECCRVLFALPLSPSALSFRNNTMRSVQTTSSAKQS